MISWTRVIVEWANCLGIVDSTIESIQDLQDGEFYERLISQLCKGNESFTGKTAISRDKHEPVAKFIQTEYPEFGSVDCAAGIPEEFYVASLLLVQCTQQPMFHRPMCIALRHETQVRIKRFLEMVLPCGKKLTKDSIGSAILELEDVSTSEDSSTPTVRPLREFFNSPAVRSARSQRFMNDRNRELMCLRAQLETEQFEKADLMEDLKIQNDKISNLQKKLDEKTRELRELRINRFEPSTPQSCRKIKRASDNEERYRREADSLQTLNSELTLEIERLREEREELARRLTSSEKFTLAIREKYEQSENSVEHLVYQLEMKNNEILDLRMSSEELREQIRQIKVSAISEQSFDVEPICDEAMSSVVDIQLQEARKESSQLKSDLAELRVKLDNTLRDCEQLRGLEVALREKTSELDRLASTLRETEEKLSSTGATVARLESEKSCLREALRRLEILVQEKDELLSLAEQRRNELEADLEIVNSKARELEISLTAEKSRTNELRSNVSILEGQTKDLRSVLSSTEEKLSLVAKEKEDLNAILEKTNGELRESIVSLKTEKLSVERLESIVARCKSESEDLQNKLVSSESRIVTLSEDKKLVETNLESAAKKLEATENCLNVERARVGDLESTLARANDDIEDLKGALRSKEKLLSEERSRVEELEIRAREGKSDNENLQRILEEMRTKLEAEKEASNELRRIVSDSKRNSDELEASLRSKSELLESLANRETSMNEELKSRKLRIEDLEESLRSETANVRKLEEELSLVRENCVELEAKLASTEGSLKETEIGKTSLERELQEAAVKIDEIRASLEMTRAKLSSVEEEKERAVSANDKLEEYARVVDEKIVNVEIKVFDYERRIKDLDESLTRRIEICDGLQKELSENNILVDSLSRRLSEASEREIALAESARESERVIADLKALGGDLENRLAREREESIALRDENASLGEKLSGHVIAKTELEEKLVRANDDLEKARENLRKECSSSGELRETLEGLRNDSEKQGETLRRRENEITTILREKDALESGLASRVDELSIAGANIERLERELEESQENIARKSSTIEKLESSIESAIEARDELEKRSARERDRLTAVLSERDRLREELASEVAEKSIMKQRIEALEREFEESNESVARKSSTIEELETRIKDLAETHRRLEEELTRAKSDFAAVLRERDDLREKLIAEDRAMSALRSTVERLGNDLEECGEDILRKDETIRELRIEVDNASASIDGLKGDLEERGNQLTTALSERDSLTADLATRVEEASILRRRMEEIERGLEESNEIIVGKSSTIEELRMEIESASRARVELDGELTEEKNRSAAVLGERDSLRRQLASRVDETSRMKERIEKTERELEERDAIIEEKSSMLEELETKHGKLSASRDELERELTRERNQLEAMRTEEHNLREELAVRVSEASIMKQRVEKLDRELDESDRELQKETSICVELRKELESLRATNAELDDELAKEKNHRSVVSSEKNRLEEEIASYVAEKSDMERRIDDLERELDKVSSALEVRIAANEESNKRELELSEARNNLQAELSRERERARVLEVEKTRAESEIASFARSRADMIEEISALNKELESCRKEQRNLRIAREKESTELRQRVAELSEESKLRDEEMRALKGRLDDAKSEKQRLEEKIRVGSQTVASLEKRLVLAESAREELKLEDKLKEEALGVVRGKLEQLGKEKIEAELRMKEVIVNLQEVRSSQDQVLEAQVKALEDKAGQLAGIEKELDGLRISVEEKTKELDEERSRMKDVVEELEGLRRKSDGDSALVEDLRVSLERERSKIRETAATSESLNDEIAEIEKISKVLRVELGSLWDTVRRACPELAPLTRDTLGSESSARDLVASFVDDAKTIREAVSILGEANETLKERLDSEKETAKMMRDEMEKRKFELDERLSDMEDRLGKRDEYLGRLIERKKNLQGLLGTAISEREEADDELVHLTERWKLLNIEAQSFLTSGSAACEELEQLRAKRVELENSLSTLNRRHVQSSKALLKALCRIFVWSETNLREACDVSRLPVKEEFSPETVLSDEIKRDEIMRGDFTSLGEGMNEFSNLLKTYEEKLKSGVIKLPASNEEKLQAQLEAMQKERKEMKDKLDAARVRNAKMEKNMDELRNHNKKLKVEITEAVQDEERAELEKLRALKDKLEREKADLLKKINDNKEVEARLEAVHSEYGQKLEKIKQKMKTAYNEQIAKLSQEQEKILKEKMDSLRVQTEQQCRKYTEDIAKYKAHITDLSSRYWDVGEKLLAETQEKQAALQQLQRFKEQQRQETTAEVNEKVTQSRQKTASLDRREFSTDRAARDSTLRAGYRAVEVIEEETTTFSTRRHSVKSIQAMGNAFKAEDEEGELFDSVYLADLKEGRCAPLAPDMDRISELRIRNSMCRPHLKSSYAVETNLQPVALNEDDIKNGVAGDDVFNDSLSQSLLPGQKPKRKDRTQTSYKRPGPPTPSKNGGRLSLQGNELKSPNSRILKERNVERRTTATPRGLKNLFGTSMSKRQDENAGGTPKGRRLSNIFRKQRTERN